MVSVKTFGRALGLIAAAAAMSHTAQAALVWIDPDGPAGINPAVQVGAIDFLPGNALNKNALVAGLNPFTNYYQARVAALLDANNAVIPIIGLNDPTSPNAFELTVVGQFDLVVTGAFPGPGSLTTNTSLAGVQQVNFVKLFYDTNVNANDLAGTGFTDGLQILGGSAVSFAGTFIELLAIPPAPLDNYGVNNYPGVLSNTGVGGAAASAVVTSTDPTFFISPPGVIGLDFSTTNAMPFSQTNPSALFLGVPANVGAINGVSGPDIQLQADGAASFLVPEPGSLMMLGLASFALVARRPRQRR